jgi:hypothetical protein
MGQGLVVGYGPEPRGGFCEAILPHAFPKIAFPVPVARAYCVSERVTENRRVACARYGFSG